MRTHDLSAVRRGKSLGWARTSAHLTAFTMAELLASELILDMIH
jgi:hypothetical protein